MDLQKWIWGAHFFAVVYMTGVIWVIQLVHYPSMKWVKPERFLDFHQMHSNKITWVVAWAMLLQLLSALALEERKGLYLSLSVGVFLSTFLLSVPIHNRLAKEPSLELIEKLIWTNWPRTILWTLHSALLLEQFTRR